MNPFKDIESRAKHLLVNRRGICGHVSADQFVKTFVRDLVYYHATGQGNAERTLSLLEDDSNLTDSSILNTNFRCKLSDLISVKLSGDDIFPKLFRDLMQNNGKGIGIGELALPLILSNYRFSTESDGVFDGNNKVEIKKNGASLKPVPTNRTQKGLVDTLNKKYWEGTEPGKVRKNDYNRHLSVVKKVGPENYRPYFADLWPGCDTEPLSEQVVDKGAWKNPDRFNTEVGKFALREYQKVDKWNNIIYIDMDTETVVNVKDPEDIDSLGLKFSPKFKRGGDTQAMADGYVNASIVRL